jgi:two-component system, NarL family, nitrate/nitrite response regulator NarL
VRRVVPYQSFCRAEKLEKEAGQLFPTFICRIISYGRNSAGTWLSYVSSFKRVMADLNATPIRVLLIDNQCIIRLGLEKLINSQWPGMEVIGKFPDCSPDVLAQLEKLSPDIILLDPYLEVENGINAIRQLIAASKAKVLIFTALQDRSVYDKLMIAGAKGIVGKKEAEATILRAIEKVYEGQLWLDHAGMERLVLELSGRKSVRETSLEAERMKTLTSREKKIVETLISNAGASGKVIAETLHISESTLRNHLGSIYQKLGVPNRLGLLDYIRRYVLNHENA